MYIKLCRTHFDTVPHSYLVLKTEILKVGNLRPNMTLICWKLLYSEKNKHVRLKFVEKVVHKCILFFSGKTLYVYQVMPHTHFVFSVENRDFKKLVTYVPIRI